ncbi:hypothetical protein RRG08_056275 [Elysia crispata]|uniref:Uncharacterized protein n=1 Tax=Elysia crispata TaxID=231223 RepID=A0AAE1E5Y3_9GAST|nr:hypothetical protein RRG08_056275 [Elysia crispata]
MSEKIPFVKPDAIITHPKPVWHEVGRSRLTKSAAIKPMQHRPVATEMGGSKLFYHYIDQGSEWRGMDIAKCVVGDRMV